MSTQKRNLISTLLGIFITLAMPGSIVPAQIDFRVVHVLHNDCPVELGGLKVAENPIEPTKPFEASEGWLKDLSWELENTRKKPAVYIEINLDFHGLAGREDSVFKYRYGQVPNTSGESDATKVLRHRVKTRITISDEMYENIKSFIQEKQPNFIVSVVELKVSKVLFEDGTMWPAERKATSR